MTDYHRGLIGLALVKAISSFARNTVDCLNYTRALRTLGIGVCFEEQNINSLFPDSECLITLHEASPGITEWASQSPAN